MLMVSSILGAFIVLKLKKLFLFCLFVDVLLFVCMSVCMCVCMYLCLCVVLFCFLSVYLLYINRF